MRILYLGEHGGQSGLRAKALVRLRHDVLHIDPRLLLPTSHWVDRIAFHVGPGIFETFLLGRLARELNRRTFELVWVNGGRWFSKISVDFLHTIGAKVVNFNNDDPFGSRDKRSWSLYRRAVPAYDLLVVLREPNVAEGKAHGAKRVLRTMFFIDDELASYKQEGQPMHAPTEILFVGTWMPERGAFLAKLLHLGVPLRIFGNQYDKAREWPTLKRAWGGPGLRFPDEYCSVVQAAGVCLGLLSKGNRDLVTSRSIEIPFLGSVLCAERTIEHLQLYEDGVEALFWKDVEECAAQCMLMLKDEARRVAIAQNGYKRCLKNQLFSGRILPEIVEQVFA